MPSRFATPGRKPSIAMSEPCASRATICGACADFRSSARLRLLRFSVSNCTGTYARPGSPFGGSTLMTDAPRSARIAEQKGPGTNIEKSTTRMPASASQGSAMLLQIRRRVDHHDARALAGDDEKMHRIRGEEAGFAGLHLELPAGDFHVRFAFEEVAHLLDATMRMR